MRVTDDRYNRDRLRLELALRLIGHEARTHTIRLWTGLSDDRIRKLFRAYIRPSAGVRRRRGKSPQQPSHSASRMLARLRTRICARFIDRRVKLLHTHCKRKEKKGF